MPVELRNSNIIINYGPSNFFMETVKSKLIINSVEDPIGAQWTYNSVNTNVYHMGNVGVGTKTPSYPLHVNGNMFVSSTAFTGSGQTTWTIPSDRRIKENIVKASYETCLENVKNIELYRFNFKDNVVNTNDLNQLGFIAQEVQSVYPKAVEVNMIKDNNGIIPDLLSLNTTQIDYTLYGAVKELIKKVEILEQKLVESSSNIVPQPISYDEYLRNLMMLPPHLHKIYDEYLRKLMMYPEVPVVPNESTSNIQIVPEISNESSNIIE